MKGYFRDDHRRFAQEGDATIPSDPALAATAIKKANAGQPLLLEEIAQIMGVSRPRVRILLDRAERRLRKELADYDEGS